MSKYNDFTKENFDQAIIGGDTIFPIEFSLVSDEAESNLAYTYTIAFCLVRD